MINEVPLPGGFSRPSGNYGVSAKISAGVIQKDSEKFKQNCSIGCSTKLCSFLLMMHLKLN
jgi:hypothetical protein